jgi:lipopolysaccharide export system protein LptA
MLKILFLLTFLPLLLCAEMVEITSKSFEAKDAQKQARFIDDVTVKQGKSWIHGDEVIVYFDDNNETTQYDAIGNTTFEVFNEENHYKGKAQKVTHYPKTSKYLFAGDVVIDDIVNKRHIVGNIVEVSTVKGDAQVKGSDRKPMKFIFDSKNKK